LVRYVVLGFTAGRSSAELIGRFKTEGELRDVFEGGPRLALRASRRGLYIFRECGPGEGDCLYIITFDIRSVEVRDPRRARSPSRVRVPSHEYSEIREALLSKICGSVDLSTYVCFDNYANEVDRYLRGVRASYRVAYYRVRPWRDEDRDLVREAIQDTLGWIAARALELASKVANVAPQGYGQVRKKAVLFLEELGAVKELAKRVEAKLRELGVELQVLQAVVDSERMVREAIQRREELRARGRPQT